MLNEVCRSDGGIGRIDTITGEGLAEALLRAEVIVDVASSPSFEDTAVLELFRTSGRNPLAAETAAEFRHHVALSIVGTDRSHILFVCPRQARPREPDRDLRHSLHHRPFDPIPEIPRRHPRFYSVIALSWVAPQRESRV
jgi:hypothetical protein